MTLRVLWFTNTPSLSGDYLNNASIGGGWIGALESELSDISSIELGISFNFNRPIKPFKLNRTQYFPIYIKSPKGKVKDLIARWRKSIENENDVERSLEVINEFKPDIIHIFGTEGVFGLIISKTNVPCVIHLQGNLIICDHKWYTGLTAVDVLKYSKKMDLLKGFGLYHKYFVNKKEANREKKIYQECKFFMGRTDWDRRISSVLSPGSKYFECDEIIRPEFYSHRWRGQKNKAVFTIITTIRNNIYKGLETIFECKTILSQLNLKSKLVWKIAGVSETDELPYLLERKYKSTFYENHIELLGPLAEKELINEMIEADTFIHASHIDNSPNSLCEAMVLGMPIIATFAGGIPSILENKKEGLLVQDGDPYALAGAILELKENSNYAIELGINARAKALSRHDPQKIVDKLLNIYSSIAIKNEV